MVANSGAKRAKAVSMFGGVGVAALVAASLGTLVVAATTRASVTPDYYLPFENPPGSPTGTATLENFGSVGGSAAIVNVPTSNAGGANFSYSSDTPNGSADSGYFAEAKGMPGYSSATLAMPNATGGTGSSWGDTFSLDDTGGDGDQAMTIDAWVKLPTNGSVDQIAYKGNPRSQQPGWLLQASGGGALQFDGWTASDAPTQLNGSIDLQAGVWTNVGMVVTVGSSPSLEFYVNGVGNLGGSSPMATLAIDSTDPLYVGSGGALMDNVKIYGTALTSAQMADLVPEPSVVALLGLAGAGLLLLARPRGLTWRNRRTG